MKRQDPKMRAPNNFVDPFFTAIATNQDTRIVTILRNHPTLIYAIDPESGISVISFLLTAVKNDPEKNLYTLQVILHTLKELGIVPDLTLLDMNGMNARDTFDSLNTALQDNILELFSDYDIDIYSVEPAASAYTSEELAQLRVGEDKYFNKAGKRAEKLDKFVEDSKPSGGGKKDDGSSKGGGKKGGFFGLWPVLQDENEDIQDLYNDLFSKKTTFFNNLKDGEKQTQESFDSLKGISFASDIMPKSSLLLSMPLEQSSDVFSIMVIPKELIDYSVEQIFTILGNIYNYFDTNDGSSN